MVEPRPRLALFACNCLRLPEGDLTRELAYRLIDAVAGQLVLGCLPALAAGVREDVDFIEQFPVVTLEGCPKACAAAICARAEARLQNQFSLLPGESPAEAFDRMYAALAEEMRVRDE